MKPRISNPFRLHSAISATLSVASISLFAAPSAFAATFYWDSTNPANSAGFGDAAGTWAQNSTSGSGRWTTSSGGTASGSAGQTTSNTDTFNFGTSTNGLGAGTVTVSGSVTMGNTNFGSASGAIVLSGGTINFRDVAIVTVNNSTNTIASIVGGAGTSFTKSGDGTLVLSNNNTYSGDTNIGGGTLVLGNNGTAGKLSTNSAINVATNANFTVRRNNLTQQGVDFSGAAITGGGSFTKSGAGTTVLNATNAYTGDTTIAQGTLVLGNGTAGKLSTSSAITIDTGANFTVQRSDLMQQGVDFSGAAITGGGSFTKDGAGTTVLNATNAYTGTTTINDGVLRLDSAGALSGGIGATGGTSALVFNGGVLGLGSGDFERSVGTDSTQVSWTGNGGFAAYGANRTVDVGTTSWTAANSIGSGNTLILGAADSDATLIWSSTLSFSGSARNVDVNDGSAAIDARFSGQLTGGGSSGLNKTGAGTLELTNMTNSYIGATSVSEGTLVVNGNISTSSLTTVQDGAALGGSGTTGALTIDLGGTLTPGNSPGILNVNGDYIQNGTLSLELNGTVAGSQHDQVNVSGSVTLSGLLTATAGYTPASNDLLFILLNDEADAVSGTFSGLAQGDTVNFSGYDWQISYTADSTGGTFLGGNDVALMAIPEPRAALLGSLGLLALLRRRRSS